jgi:6-pyruvoyltetrahydropterin/6-carboxytetrahydropterin synthase
MHRIGKEFGFDYGHRVWTQELNSEYSLDSRCVCRHLHGHRGMVIVFLEGDPQPNGMVTDFKHLNWFKKFLDDVLDHKMILDISDPALSHFFPLIGNSPNIDELKLTMNVVGEHRYWTPMLSAYSNQDEHVQEIYEGLVIVNFVPTSENLSKWLFEIAENKMAKINVKVGGIQFFETPKSQSNYSKD